MITCEHDRGQTGASTCKSNISLLDRSKVLRADYKETTISSPPFRSFYFLFLAFCLQAPLLTYSLLPSTMRYLTLLPVLAIAVAAHGTVEKRAQPGVPQPVPVDLRPLTWGDVNIIQTTGKR